MVNNLILFNITINIDNSVHDEWLEWVREVHIPVAMRTNLFLENKMFKLLNEEDNGGVTYSIQFFSDSVQNVNFFLQKYATNWLNEHNLKYKDKHVVFMTMLQEI